MGSDIANLSAIELVEAYQRGELSPEEVVRDTAQRIEDLNPALNAFSVLCLEQAVEESRSRTSELHGGALLGPLHGVPVAIKELFDLQGMITSYGSLVFKDHRPASDAQAVGRLRAAGAIIVGSTRSHEFGWGITSQHEVLGGVRNPWNLDRVPGGSSGGSAAAVAAGLVPLALGTDTGGSVRLPAAYCGIVGFKPTFGRISKRGVMPLAPSLDHVGVLARTFEDSRLCIAVMSTLDEADPFMSRDLPDLPSAPRQPPGPGARRVLYPNVEARTFLSDDYRVAFDRTIACLSDAGFELTEAAGIDRSSARSSFGKVQMAEAFHQHSSRLGTFPARQPLYGTDVRERLEAASQVTIRDYLDGMEGRREISRRFEMDFESADVVLSPIAGGSPALIAGGDLTEHRGEEIEFRDLVLGFTVPQDLAGIPAVTIHVGHDRFGVPIAVQVAAARGREHLLMQVAAEISSLLEEAGIPRPGLAPIYKSQISAQDEGESS